MQLPARPSSTTVKYVWQGGVVNQKAALLKTHFAEESFATTLFDRESKELRMESLLVCYHIF